MPLLLNDFLEYANIVVVIGFKALLLIVALLLGVAYLTLAERKVIGYMQLRIGPNVVGPFGLFQPIADGIKLLHKETIIPMAANKLLFFVAPVLLFSLSLAAWAVIPFAPGWVFSDINVGVLYLLAISSLGVYGIIIAGWSSNSKYAMLGALRSAAQMISYEVSIGLILVSVLLCSGSLNLSDIILAQQNGWYAIKLFPLFVMYFISCLAETNRTPFDLPEAEAELVAGYHVEYSAFPFALFFLGEYANMILMSAMCTILFAGGWLAPFAHASIDWIPSIVWFLGKICVFLFVFLWTRATLPRYRYDQLMRLGWKVFLPLSLLGVVIVSFCVMLKGAA